jgi:predicted phosphodiesterase
VSAGSPYDDCPRVVAGPGSPARPLRRFALIGDVHAEDARLEAAIALARAASVEAFLCVGDVADGHGDLDRTLTILVSEGVIVARGNHDRWFLTDELRTLVPTQLRAEHPRVAQTMRYWLPFVEASTVRGPLLLCHAIGDDDFAFAKPRHTDDEIRAQPSWTRLRDAGRFRFMAAGHTHEAMVRTIDGVTILNPGTLKRDDDPCTAIVDLELGVMDVHDLADASMPRLRERLVVPR